VRYIGIPFTLLYERADTLEYALFQNTVHYTDHSVSYWLMARPALRVM
jgi:hypothetical protein